MHSRKINENISGADMHSGKINENYRLHLGDVQTNRHIIILFPRMIVPMVRFGMFWLMHLLPPRWVDLKHHRPLRVFICPVQPVNIVCLDLPQVALKEKGTY